MTQAWRIFGEVLPLLAVMGLISVIAAWRLVRRSHLTGNTSAVVDSIARIGAAAAVVAAAIITLTPVGGAGGVAGVNLVPLQSLIDLGTRSVDASVAIRNIAGNLMLLFPFGAALGVALRQQPRPLRSVLLAGLVVSVAIEAAQYLLAVGRVVDIDDVLLNVLGAWFGAALTFLLIWAGGARSRSTAREQADPAQ